MTTVELSLSLALFAVVMAAISLGYAAYAIRLANRALAWEDDEPSAGSAFLDQYRDEAIATFEAKKAELRAEAEAA